MTEKIETIINNLKSLTLLEAAELVNQIEEVFNVDASTTQFTNMSSISNEIQELGATSRDEEQTEFDVTLEEVPTSKKIAILKVVRSLTGLGLKEAKDLVESAPKVLKDSISKEDANEIKAKLEDAGAKVTIK